MSCKQTRKMDGCGLRPNKIIPQTDLTKGALPFFLLFKRRCLCIRAIKMKDKRPLYLNKNQRFSPALRSSFFIHTSTFPFIHTQPFFLSTLNLSFHLHSTFLFIHTQSLLSTTPAHGRLVKSSLTRVRFLRVHHVEPRSFEGKEPHL